MTFVWTDRDGQRHELDSPAPIEAEAAALEQEMDRYVDMLDNSSRMIRDPARAASTELRSRLERLLDDLARWNVHVIKVIRAEAAKLADQIDRLPATLADILLVAELHGEHDRLVAITSGAPDMRARMLAEPMTALQRSGVTACASRDAPEAATRGEAKAWLDQQLRFARNAQADGGWFAWIDRNGHAHRLTGPLAIEREVAKIAKELAKLRPALEDTSEPDAIHAAVDTGSASWERLSNLQQDLERYNREATAWEDTAWTAYAADWRSKRKTS